MAKIVKKDISVALESAGFSVSKLKDGCYEIETWTDGGVNMLHYFKDRTELKQIVKDFDIDNEVLPLWNNDMRYRAKFVTLSKALSDMRKYRAFLRKTVKQL